MNEDTESLQIERELMALNQEQFWQLEEGVVDEPLTPEEQGEETAAELDNVIYGLFKQQDEQEKREAGEQWKAALAAEAAEKQEADYIRGQTELAAKAESTEPGSITDSLQGMTAGVIYQEDTRESTELQTAYLQAVKTEEEERKVEAEIQEIEAVNQELMRSVTVTDTAGVKMATISDERYQELLATEEENKKCRYLGVEQFRVWAQGLHPEVVSVQDALRACSIDEMKKWLNELAPVMYGSNAMNAAKGLFQELYARLKHREELRAEAQRKLKDMEAVMPDG